MKPLLHAFADAVDVLQCEAEENFGQVVLGDDGQPVGLLQIGPGRRRGDHQSCDDARRVSLAIEIQLAAMAPPQAALALRPELVFFAAARIMSAPFRRS